MWEIREECGGEETIEAASLDEAIEAAEEWVRGGEYSQDEHSVSVQYWVEELPPEDAPDDWEGEEHDGTVEMHPEEPECKPIDPDDHATGHDWQRPIEVVGGIEENPGVWGHGGGVKSTSVCAQCGMYYQRDTWHDDGRGGHMETEEYEDADDASEAWVRSRMTETRRVLRYHGADGPMVYDPETEEYSVPTQDDMDDLPVGAEMSDEDWDDIEE
jgi:hypothetical protein